MDFVINTLMKILITYASAGAGHRKAAEALYHSIKKNTSHEATICDSLDYANPLFKKLYTGSYAYMITHAPFLWKFVYEVMDLPWLQGLIRLVRGIYNQVTLGRFHQYLINEKFDYIFSTHFMASEICGRLKKQRKIASRVVTIVTDYDVHRIWVVEGIDIFCVASDFTADRLKHLGVLERQIVVTGIPVDEKFIQVHDIVELKEKLGLIKDGFTVLIATGSFGIGPIEAIVDELRDFQVMVVCGHNRKLFERLKAKQRENLHVLGLVDNMHELMAVADCMVTKPGGLSITEALVSQLPLIFFNAIPGQEVNNVKVLKQYGIGISDCPIDQIGAYLRTLAASKDAHRNAVNHTKELARPQAVRDIRTLIT